VCIFETFVNLSIYLLNLDTLDIGSIGSIAAMSAPAHPVLHLPLP